MNRIQQTVMSGDAVLLTGAGFSCSVRDRHGRRLPLARTLTEALWAIAFPDDPIEETSLQEVYEAALQVSPTLVEKKLKELFVVDPNSVPERLLKTLKLPWAQRYTLNVDDSIQNIGTEFGAIQAVTAFGTVPTDIGKYDVPYVHLNGMVHDFPRVTFGQSDFAERMVRGDMWYQNFVLDLETKPVVVIGSAMNEAWIWQMMQRDKGDSSSEYRPKSYVVTPHLPLAKKRFLESLKFEHIPLTEEQFFDEYLAPLVDMDPPTRVREKGSAFSDVGRLVVDARPGDADFLLGEAPAWGDVVKGYAVPFAVDSEIADGLRRRNAGEVLCIVGTAGSGKTTAMMRAAARSATNGKAVLWFNADYSGPLGELRREVAARRPDIVYIDDVDRFAHSAEDLLAGIRQGAPEVKFVVAARGHRYGDYQYGENDLWQAVFLDRLTSTDSESLLSALVKANRLGALRGLSHGDQMQKLSRLGEGGLVVTLIEATSGESFREKIRSECEGMSPAQIRVYGIVCTALMADKFSPNRRDLLMAAGGVREQTVEVLHALQGLVEGRLLRRLDAGDDSRFSARHRVVAEEAVAYFRESGMVLEWYNDLIYMCASQYEKRAATKSLHGRLLKRLVNHDLIRKLLVSRDDVRAVYVESEKYLSADPHFWLQRGSYEIKEGRLKTAENFLLQAKGLNESDDLIATAWNSLQLQKCLESPLGPRASERARESLGELLAVISRNGPRSPHTYREFLAYGLKWWQSGYGEYSERRWLRSELLRVAQEARKTFHNNSPVLRAASDVQSVLR